MDDPYSREPCPLRILEDSGSGFLIGSIGGAIFSGAKGFLDAPSSIRKRLASSAVAVRTGSPRTAGTFAAWALTFASLECTLLHFRGHHDAFSSILSGAGAGGILAARQGKRVMLTSALMGGLILGIIEGGMIFLQRLNTQFEPQPPPPIPMGYEGEGPNKQL